MKVPTMLPVLSGKERARRKDVEAVDIKTPTVTRKECFVEENRGVFLLFTILGLFAVRRVDGQYLVRKVRFFFFYLSWITYPLGGLFVAGKTVSWFAHDEKISFMHDTFAVLALAVLPALQAYSLKFMTKSLPEALQNISELSVMEVGFETPLKLSWKRSKVKISPGDKDCQQGERLFEWLPRAMVVFSLVAFFTVCSTEYLMGVDLQSLDKEVPTLVILSVCLAFPFASTLIVVAFTKWLTMVYKTLNHHCQEVAPVCKVDQVLAICSYVDRLQKIFSLLNSGFFRYILTINAGSITVGASFCTSRLLLAPIQIVYLGPLVFHVFTLGLVCEAGGRLAAQHDNLVTWLKKEIRQRKLPTVVPSSTSTSTSSTLSFPSTFCSSSSPCTSSSSYLLLYLLDDLLEYPPQITTFGNYKINRSFLVKCLGFVFSYGTIANQFTDNTDCEDYFPRVLRNLTAEWIEA